MRVIAGKYRSRVLRSMPGLDIRPTSDRLRETLFNVLTGGNPEALQGSTWIDLYAGTGAVGIEAFSRGAARVEFVESSHKAAGLIRANLRSLRVEDGFTVHEAETVAGLRAMKGLCADFVFLDPPYRLEDEYQRALAALDGSSLLRHGSLVIAEHHKKFDPGTNFAQLRRVRTLHQADATLSFYVFEAADDATEPA